MESTSTASADFTIAVPRVYRDELVGAQNKVWLFIVCAYAAVSYLWNVIWKHGWHISHVEVIYGIGLVVWLYQLRKPWHYKISDKRITLPSPNGSVWPWLWKQVAWDDDIAEATEWQWGALPGILFKTKDDDELLMVYTQEDEGAMRQHVFPHVQRFILPDRQEYWAERWRTS